MKLGIIPCFIPTLLAVYLNSIALSAILKAEVYARAVSKTPGPVSVSTIIEMNGFSSLGNVDEALTMTLNCDIKLGA